MSINSRNGSTLLESGSFPPVRAATVAAIALSGLQTIDTIALAEGDRVLVKDQADATTNGLYAASPGDWVRTADASSNQDFFQGMAVICAQGAVNAGITFICTSTDDPVVIGTSQLTFADQMAVANARQSGEASDTLTIGVGAKAFTIGAGKDFSVGQWVLAQEAANSANQMLGKVTAYAGGVLTLQVTATGGAGTFSDWSLALTNSPAAAGWTPPLGSGNVTGPGGATPAHLAAFADNTGLVLADGGKAGALANLDAVTAQFLAASALGAGGPMVNGTIVASVAGGALTVAIKTLAGNDPSPADPVLFLFRDGTFSAGDYEVFTLTSARSITISAGSTLGFANATPGRLWLAAFRSADAFAPKLSLINCLSGTSIFPLGATEIASSVADDGAGGSDLPQLFYTDHSVNPVGAKPLAILGALSWEPGGTLPVAGTWNVLPSRLSLYRPGMKLPGDEVQSAVSVASSFASGSTIIPVDNTVPQSTEGDQYMSQAITPSSGANVLSVDVSAQHGCSTNIVFSGAIFQDSLPNALVARVTALSNAAENLTLGTRLLAATTIQTTFKYRAGPANAFPIAFNSASGSAVFGGAAGSFLRVRELMA